MTTTNESEYETVTTQITVKPKGKSIFDLGVTHIGLEDGGDGLFLVISQESDDRPHKISIDLLEWEHVKTAVDRMVTEAIASEQGKTA